MQTNATLQEQLILEHIKKLERAEKNFLPFVRHVWPEFISGYHHRKIAKKFEDIAQGKIKRLIVNMPPRHTKSEFASFLFPSWLVGNNPKLKIIQTTHNTELAERFGRKMKNLIDSDMYKQVFDEVAISADSKAAGVGKQTKAVNTLRRAVGRVSRAVVQTSSLLMTRTRNKMHYHLQHLTAPTSGIPLVLVNVYSRVVLSSSS